jgi:hypothetical protein
MYADTPYASFFSHLKGPRTQAFVRAAKKKGRSELAKHERVYQVQGLIPERVNLICKYAMDFGTEPKIRDAAMFALNALTWFRGDTMYRLRLDNLELFNGTYFIKPDMLKNSQNGEKVKGIPLVRNAYFPAMCSVRTMKAWLYVRGLEDGYLFCQFDKTGHIPRVDSPLNREIYVNNLHTAIIDCGIATAIGYREWGTHSFRRGGATWAAYNGLNLHEIQEWGCWRSVSAAVRYVDKVGFLNSPVARLYQGKPKNFHDIAAYESFVKKSSVMKKLSKTLDKADDEDSDDDANDDASDRDENDDDDDEESDPEFKL